jgi:hypothetical protein
VTYIEDLFVENFNQVEDLLKYPDPDNAVGVVVWTAYAEFGNKFSMDVEVCSTLQPKDDPCWLQGVLRDEDLYEVGCTEVLESLKDTIKVEFEGDTYEVRVDYPPLR